MDQPADPLRTHDGLGDGPAAYPAGLRLAGRRVVVVGGGHVAQRRVPTLIAAGADVLLVVPRGDPGARGAARPARSPGPRGASRTATSTRPGT